MFTTLLGLDRDIKDFLAKYDGALTVILVALAALLLYVAFFSKSNVTKAAVLIWMVMP
jgi:hypothetical protein